MRSFWIVVGVLLVAASAVLLIERGWGGSGGDAPVAKASEAAAAMSRRPARPRVDEPTTATKTEPSAARQPSAPGHQPSGEDRGAAAPATGHDDARPAAAASDPGTQQPELEAPDETAGAMSAAQPAAPDETAGATAAAQQPAPDETAGATAAAQQPASDETAGTTTPAQQPASDETAGTTTVAQQPAPDETADTTAPAQQPAPDETADTTTVAQQPAPAEPTVTAAPAETPSKASLAAQLAAELHASAEAREREAETARDAEATAAPEATPTEQAAAPAPPRSTEGLVKQDDGSWLVDDRFVMRGAGTADDPYRVSWDHLVSASETYKPRKGMTDIPAWVQLLHGAQVKLTGYLAFPLASQTVDEALVMLNQWDGCCIGVPPTPYDGVEVRLASPIELKQGDFFRFGNVTGTFKVDPYLVNDWLVGLYLMEDARLEVGM